MNRQSFFSFFFITAFMMPASSFSVGYGTKTKKKFELNSEKGSDAQVSKRKKNKKPSALEKYASQAFEYLKSDDGKQLLGNGVKYVAPLVMMCGGGYYFNKKLQNIESRIGSLGTPDLDPVKQDVQQTDQHVLQNNGLLQTMNAHLPDMSGVPVQLQQVHNHTTAMQPVIAQTSTIHGHVGTMQGQVATIDGHVQTMQPQMQQIATQLPPGTIGGLATKDDVNNVRIALLRELYNAFGIRQPLWEASNIAEKAIEYFKTNPGAGAFTAEALQLKQAKYLENGFTPEGVVKVIGKHDTPYLVVALNVNWTTTEWDPAQKWNRCKPTLIKELPHKYGVPEDKLVLIGYDQQGKKWLS